MSLNNRFNLLEMNNKLSDIVALIQQNPKLSNIKPESLLEKISNV
jgi:hypothetical protein